MRSIKYQKLPIAGLFQIARMSIQVAFAYKFEVFFQILKVLFQIYLLKAIWTAIYTTDKSVSQIQLRELIAYLTLANLQTWVFAPTIADSLQQRVRTGAIALDLVRPVGFISQLLAQQMGSTLGLLPFLLGAFPLALLAGGMQLPASLEAFLFYIISLVLACLVVSLMGLLIGLISFWTLEATGIELIYHFVSQLFAGALIPLWFFPPILRTVADLLPFQAVAFLPVSIYLGTLHGTQIFDALVLQLFWIIMLYLLVRLVWFSAQKRITIQGG